MQGVYGAVEGEEQATPSLQEEDCGVYLREVAELDWRAQTVADVVEELYAACERAGL